MARGVEGCGVTKYTVEQVKWLRKNGYNVKVYAAKDKGRQCVHTLKAFKEYNQLFRRIVEAENKDARFLYT